MESVGSNCGHEGCAQSPRCNVRYVGPMSSVHAHHALHAARGVGHIWAASIITGFAVVVTGVIAFQSADAKSSGQVGVTQSAQMMQLNQRLDRLEQMVLATKMACEGPIDPTTIDPNADPGAGVLDSAASTTANGGDTVPVFKKSKGD